MYDAVERPAHKPLVVQHSFGDVGSGGPIGALGRILASDLTQSYDFVRMHQQRATGGIDVVRLREWSAFLRRVQPDLVHVRGLGNEGFHGALAARLAGCRRVLVSVHGTVRDITTPPTLKQRLVVDGLEPMTLRMATHVTTVCEYAAERPFVKRHHEKMVGPIVNGVEVPDETPALQREETRRALGLTDSQVAVVSVGRLTLEKGHRDLAGALERLSDTARDSMVLVLVGDGPEGEVIRRTYEQTGVATRFLGRRLDVPQILGAADVFAFPSLHENLSNALLEAMAHGLAVVATSVGGTTEVLRGGGGLLVPVNDPAALSQALERVVESVGLRRRLGTTARQVVAEKYSIEAMCRVLDLTYQQVLSS